MTLKLPAFEEKSDYAGTTGYEVTNEEPDLIQELMRSIPRCQLGGGIAGGGEIPLFCLLPRCEKVIVADHSRSSLAAFMVKVLLLQDLPTIAELRATLEVQNNYTAAITKLAAHIPEKLKASAITSNTYSGLLGSWLNLRREWHYLSDRQLALARRRLHRLVVLHADLMDLAERGPFDVLYVSNAQDHRRKDTTSLVPKAVTDMIKPGGHLIYTINAGCLPPWGPAAKVIKTIAGYRTSWAHVLAQKAAA